ncbi:MAG: hypothetical protein Hyperionvirus16_25 [Hyperionvirus sp.]|uniref:Uncharacterized protein n=1 Tax=Hyperionvirus sp. TaxID=2487770 RepID=A0A3G5A9X3_9VIRU|nr:MAG: hypothetical protein Hyperionvirus16_25 [Hyperionvirus sp.]
MSADQQNKPSVSGIDALIEISENVADIQSDEPGRLTTFDDLFFIIVCFFWTIFLLIFLVSLIGWLLCFNSEACDNHSLECCKTNDFHNFINGTCVNVISYRNCASYDQWELAIYGNIMAGLALCIIFYLIHSYLENRNQSASGR